MGLITPNLFVASINEVKSTVYEAFVLVIIIIFLFLRDWRVTLVPCIVIPVSLIGAFFVMYLAGFSINVLSMLAIVLSVGLVVDDAIVMTENIYIRIEKGMSRKRQGSKERKRFSLLLFQRRSHWLPYSSRLSSWTV